MDPTRIAALFERTNSMFKMYMDKHGYKKIIEQRDLSKQETVKKS